jgi:pSer/pThr/pTyr-binding forkhead associated (FHA) protein
MRSVTFQVVEGVDKGRIFRELSIPVTIGREEGNVLRLNDERVSRFHAKVQHDNGDIVLTDLDSTNGTRVNGHNVQIRRLRAGDRVAIGRSMLVFGSNQEIAARMATLRASGQLPEARTMAEGAPVQNEPGDQTVQAAAVNPEFDQDLDFELNFNEEITIADDALFIGQRALPPLPQKLSPAQAARIAEILDFLHRGLTRATENIQASEDGTQVTLSFPEWQKVLAVQMLLARYLRAVAEPDALID